MKLPPSRFALLALACLLAFVRLASAASQMENLGRGLVALRSTDSEVFLSWRLLGNEPLDTLFNVYRSHSDGPFIKINGSPISNSTCFVDPEANSGTAYQYRVRAIINGERQSPSRPVGILSGDQTLPYLRIPLNRPADGVTPGNESYTYSANDCSVADLDNDGEYEFVVKWDPSNSHDNAHDGYTGNVFIDAYESDGTQLWRIDLGRNIRAGSHYTQLMVYDLDGDGVAEIACKTADGTISGTGQIIGDAEADYRSSVGRILDGPEYLTLFDGQTGAALVTTDYVPERGSVSAWGDNYGNRVDRFLAGIAYLDGERPSLVMCRGYYTRTVVAAWDWRDGALSQRWVFDTGHGAGDYSNYRGQGAHSLSIADLDGDGFDEICYGACAIDHDGSGLFNTDLGHGDALHVSDMDPNNPGQEIWMVHESPSQYGDYGSDLRDGATGELIFGVSGEGADVGRGVAADIDPRHLGFETWASRGGLHNVDGTQISSRRPSSLNFLCYWDGDLLREILDGTTISKWDWENETLNPLLIGEGVSSNNSTKATPCLSADIFGDWREEVIWRETDSAALRVYSTTIPSEHRFPTLMHDRQYRVAIAWQNSGYNQPPHPSYYLGEGMVAPEAKELDLVGNGVPSEQLPVADRFPAWLEENSLPSNTPPDADPDQNGYSHLGEYAFAIGESSGPIAFEIDAESDPLVKLSTPRDEFDYLLQVRNSPADWKTEAALLGGETTSVLPFELESSVIFRVAVNSEEIYNAFPVTQIASPEQGASFNEGDTVRFIANASDTDGSIASLDFLLNGETHIQLTQAPYEVDWDAAESGTYQLRALAFDDQEGKGYSQTVTFHVVSVSSNEGQLFPAETATRSGGFLESTNTGYNGSGYVNFDVSDTTLTFSNVDGGTGGVATLRFRYALGAETSRTGQLSVNGTNQSISFSPTGTWTTWEQKEVSVSLNSGETNTIVLSSTGEDLANIDELLVIPSE